MAIPTPETMFTRDILGNYVCNTFAEATTSGPFDAVIIGGGTFGLALAQDLFFRSKRFNQGPGGVPEDAFKPASFRILVLEAGPFTLPAHVQDIPNLRLFAPGARIPIPPTQDAPLPSTRARLIAAGLDRVPLLEGVGAPLGRCKEIATPRQLTQWLGPCALDTHVSSAAHCPAVPSNPEGGFL